VGAVIGDLLPLGLGVALSPIPISAVILMLLSRVYSLVVLRGVRGLAEVRGWRFGVAPGFAVAGLFPAAARIRAWARA
jgi:hypothetical protein